MPAEKFELKVHDGRVRGLLMAPDSVSAARPCASVLICRGAALWDDAINSLFDDMARALSEAGIATVRFDHRCADLILDDFDAQGAAEDMQDLMAVVEWMSRRPELDPARISVLGYGLGAIEASSLAGSVGKIARLCLLAPTTAEDVASRLGQENGSSRRENGIQLPAAYVPSLAGIDSVKDASRRSRPTLIIHGAADRFVPPGIAAQYGAELESSRRPYEFVLVARADHAFTSRFAHELCLERVCAFLTPTADDDSGTHAAAGRA